MNDINYNNFIDLAIAEETELVRLCDQREKEDLELETRMKKKKDLEKRKKLNEEQIEVLNEERKRKELHFENDKLLNAEREISQKNI